MPDPGFEENLLREYRSEAENEKRLKASLAASRKRKASILAIMPARLKLEVHGDGDRPQKLGFVEEALAQHPEGLTVLEVTQLAIEAGYEPISASAHPGRSGSAELWSLVKTGRVYRSGGAKFRLRKEFR